MSNKLAWSFLIFIVFTSIYFSSTVGIMNSSDAPQYALTRALVEEKSIYIGDFPAWVYPDYATFAGRKLSLRSFGESLFMVPFYVWAKNVLPFSKLPYKYYFPGITDDSKLEALTVLGNATFGALILVVLYLFILDLTKNRLSALLTVITGGLGTLFWRYSSQMQRFPISSYLLLFSFYLIYKLSLIKYKKINLFLAILGFLLGCGFLIDPSVIFMIIPMLVMVVYLVIKKYKKPRKIIILFSCFMIPVLISLIYNFIAFKNPFAVAYQFMATKPYYRNLKDYYQIPLFPSLVVNLFSSRPIPEIAFGNKWWELPFRHDEGMAYAVKNIYLGIFAQTPALIFSIFGIIHLIYKKRLIGLGLLIIPLINIIQNSKFIVFFGPNSYDTHYFLPAIPFLLVGLGIFISQVLKISKKIFRRLLLTILILTAINSILNGWYSLLMNYGPHISGEHRFNIGHIDNPLFFHTFPNIYNLDVITAFYFLPVSVIFLLFYHFCYPKNIHV